ncbi:hypothetical protein [Aeromonas veronii]|uniref:HEAT repeat domain-containing protein n=1 Tax=Aeromonas veronii TaxID=654 RepID=A0A4S5CGL8_AERVE|nr:hypothetical protein [Aeromonas veronii]THJ44977.1 hypothetical protein E8Q35_12370 [Aeromonas veronii]
MDPTYLPLAEQIKLAKSSLASSRELAMLITVPHARVRQYVAQNVQTSKDTLLSLVSDPHTVVRKELASNSNLSVDGLIVLASDVEFSVRQIVAQNKACPSVQLHALAKDSHPLVRDAALQNPHTTLWTMLNCICQENSGILRTRALARIHTCSAEKWKDAVIEGLKLSDLVEYRGEHVALGDALIDIGEAVTYQSIQAAELAFRVDTKTREREDELPTPGVKFRKLSL